MTVEVRDHCMIKQGYKNLILHILMSTKNDLQLAPYRKGEYFVRRQEALQFIESEWFEALCSAVNLEPSAARKHLKNVSAKSGEQGNMA
jgi:hypothetical protein